ncbi:helix-turn-helix transcriptional regulator [Mycobacterium sp.]|uniref:helix-turn-helix domain-containing protein n=1 Tax=Mycobacterium sp. TaxID=1785 RepID=UPI0025D438D9|nr:helix-turn-helix transcriptional regulator [Mycobacterium sp.]
MNLSSYGTPARRPGMTRRVLRGFNAQAFSDARRAKDISVSDLARLADVTRQTILNWEAGKGTPQVDLLARVMRILEAAIEQVVAIPPDERYPGDWRVIRGLTQPELAAAVEMPTTTLRGIERADAGLTDKNAAKLAGHLGISVEEYRAAYQRARQRPAGSPV